MATPLPEIQRAVMRVPNGAGGFDSVEFDCVEQENHELKNTLTKHPRETGAPPTDHSRPEPRRVTLGIVQTNTPLSGADGNDRARTLWQRFVDLWQNPKLVALDTARDFYESMAIESVTSPVDAKTAQTLACTVTFEEAVVVQNKFTRIVPTKDPRGQKRKDLGKETSVAARGWDAGGRVLDSILGR